MPLRLGTGRRQASFRETEVSRYPSEDVRRCSSPEHTPVYKEGGRLKAVNMGGTRQPWWA